MGSLESYYDVIINKGEWMCNNAMESCDTACLNLAKLEDENDALNKSLETYKRRLYRARDQRDELKAELSQLKADNMHDNKVCEEYDDDLIKECHELQADNDRLKDKLNNSNAHYPKEYQAEADEWFEHNPHDEKLFFFMVGGSGVDEDGDVINTLNVGADAIAECDNYKGVISVETYK